MPVSFINIIKNVKENQNENTIIDVTPLEVFEMIENNSNCTTALIFAIFLLFSSIFSLTTYIMIISSIYNILYNRYSRKYQ